MIIALYVIHKETVPIVSHFMVLIIHYYAHHVHIYMERIVLIVIAIGVVYNVNQSQYCLIEDVDIVMSMYLIVLPVMSILLSIQLME